MSFGELGRARGGAPSRAGVSGFAAASAARPEAPRLGGNDPSQTMKQIGDWLQQFQHNLSLLERLCEGLEQDARPSDELLRQVATQQEVVEELSASVQRGLADMNRQILALPRSEQNRPRAAAGKLKKDHDRVASDLSRIVARLKQSRQAALARPQPKQQQQKAPARQQPRQQQHTVGRAQFGPSDAPGDLDVMIGSERVQLQVAMQEEAINDAILREREEEIREINQSVHKVNEIFKDLATLVDKQQNDVDQISELVEKSHQHAEKGLDQVQKAAKLQPSCAIS